MNIAIKRLINYALDHHLITKEDEIYARNLLLDVLQFDDFEDVEVEEEHLTSPQPILDILLDYVVEKGMIEDSITAKDLFDTRIMNCFMPRPSEVIKTFNTYYQEDPKKASDYYYALSQASNYMRTQRIAKDLHWTTDTKYGTIDISINLSKPEKDPKEIAKAKLLPPAKYPKCLLCKENEGYAGTYSHPARNNHRIIPLDLNGEKYFMQYSPYSYYNEHCIIFNANHIPMVINEKTLRSLLGFIKVFPHYFIGSNADLPIVGGSILTHDHFQGGNYTFAMERAEMLECVTNEKFPEVEFGRVKWPLSVLRLRSKNSDALVEMGAYILEKWRNYSDESVDILAFSGETPHNTITPIARKKGEYFELDLTLRNNRTSEEYPSGIFHPHAHLHHIKKENIGLIEVMGLAILPARLKTELAMIEEALINNEPLAESLSSHQAWFDDMKAKYSNVEASKWHDIIQDEVGHIFEEVLENAGVFKQDETGLAAFKRFMDSL